MLEPSRCGAASHHAGSARDALAELCTRYWYPLYAFIRRKGRGPEDALDLTQGYFARLLKRDTVAAADPHNGRFRSFLLADCTRFLAAQPARDGAAQWGGGAAPLSIDARDAEGCYQREPAHGRTPERLFDRDWALTLLDGVLARLRSEYEESERARLFEELKIVLTDGTRTVPHAEVARRLGTTEGGVQPGRLAARHRK